MQNTFRTVLGTNKKKPRSRIWIEGKRLVEAGFTVGSGYRRYIGKDGITLVLSMLEPEEGVELYKVSGKGDKPIIDITGKVVTDRFTGTHVNVAFDKGKITITNEEVKTV